jgi:hypothetical protein
VRRDWLTGVHEFVNPASSEADAYKELDSDFATWRQVLWRPRLSVVSMGVDDLRAHTQRDGCTAVGCPTARAEVAA